MGRGHYRSCTLSGSVEAMSPDVIAAMSQDVIGACRESAARLSDACVTMSQSAEALASDPMQRNMQGIAMLQRNAAVEVENAASFGRRQSSRVTVESLSTVKQAHSMMVKALAAPAPVLSVPRDR